MEELILKKVKDICDEISKASTECKDNRNISKNYLNLLRAFFEFKQ
jgi:hypothetical protein